MAHMQDGFPILSDDQKRLVPIHGWLMGVSWGIVVPLAILLIRMSRILDGRLAPTRVMGLLLFRIHVIFQVVAIILATCGVGFLFKHLGVTLDHTHQGLGMVVMCMMWCQFFIGLIRPTKRSYLRTNWFLVHYLFGTGAWVLGVTNVYLGMRAYEFLWRTSLRAHNIVFSIMFALFGFIYVLQEMPWLRMRQGLELQPSAPTSLI